ncbi:hypothetical protein DM860_014940 [Cuscuta australis]|uniref:Uncharacterized protein n=1 Tax=Cuscuta australis TaxID=267555 RepID=A0A328E6M4_9ASTE|nr:hypothetical protein DM860_014940 [Cuscuta australis]
MRSMSVLGLMVLAIGGDGCGWGVVELAVTELSRWWWRLTAGLVAGISGVLSGAVVAPSRNRSPYHTVVIIPSLSPGSCLPITIIRSEPRWGMSFGTSRAHTYREVEGRAHSHLRPFPVLMRMRGPTDDQPLRLMRGYPPSQAPHSPGSLTVESRTRESSDTKDN